MLQKPGTFYKTPSFCNVPPTPLEFSVAALARRHGVMRSSDFEAYGVSRVTVQRLCERGILRRLGRGIYGLADAELTEHHTLAEAARRVPAGVVCLLSALRFHELTTQNPFEVWLAIDVKAHKPKVDWPPLRIMRFSGAALTFGVEERDVEGVPVHVTSPAKTVADCFKYRNKIGVDVAVEALVAYRRERRGSVDELLRAAAVDRVAVILRPYLEALS
jgi:predicted transcriptional regulator of viral defense system